ncbi:hypothetical protein Tco_0078231 [Tanacetum coccineum]
MNTEALSVARKIFSFLEGANRKRCPCATGATPGTKFKFENITVGRRKDPAGKSSGNSSGKSRTIGRLLQSLARWPTFLQLLHLVVGLVLCLPSYLLVVGYDYFENRSSYFLCLSAERSELRHGSSFSSIQSVCKLDSLCMVAFQELEKGAFASKFVLDLGPGTIAVIAIPNSNLLLLQPLRSNSPCHLRPEVVASKSKSVVVGLAVGAGLFLGLYQCTPIVFKHAPASTGWWVWAVCKAAEQNSPNLQLGISIGVEDNHGDKRMVVVEVVGVLILSLALILRMLRLGMYTGSSDGILQDVPQSERKLRNSGGIS